ncbi:MAG: radical SAM family heme chaperone HemW [Treponema sp.]|nr:radical SAM family heme chaperone HemW [Treponema sp.]
MAVKSLSLYIHIPFCRSFCDYCDFYSVLPGTVNDDFPDFYINAVLADIRSQTVFFNVENIPAVYIGGGTPSALGARRMKNLLDGLRDISCFKPVEFTTEANPESLNEDFLAVCKESGVNRISLGIQSFDETVLAAVNRYGNARVFDEKLRLVSQFFPRAFSVDLITGLPYQNEQIVKSDIRKLLFYKPAHVSLYSLIPEEGTPLKKKIDDKTVSLPDDSDSLWLLGRNILVNAGYEHYEVSSFALPGKRCLHNTRYWNMEGWLGAGPRASGTISCGNAFRYTYPDDVHSYVNCINPFVNLALREELDRIMLIKDSILTGYRTIDGPDEAVFKKRFGINIEDCIGETMSAWRKKGFFNGTKPAGELMLFLNDFLCDAFNEIDHTKSKRL